MNKNQEHTFCTYDAKSWDDLRTTLSKLEDWVFRGHGDFSWTLSTSLERSAKRSNFDNRAIADIEKIILAKFKKRANSFLSKVPEDNNLLEWFSLIQHFGGPTRLLDFSHSFYVAIFFAVESSSSDAAIYCLNKTLIMQKGKETEIGRYPKISQEFETSEYCDNAINDGARSPLVIITEPRIYNERLAAQQGLFAVPFEVNQTFEYNLSLTLHPFQKDLPKSKQIYQINDKINDCALLKIRIPISLHKEIRKDLALMNINAATLYPGLDGFARSLHWTFDYPVTNEVIEFTNELHDKLRQR